MANLKNLSKKSKSQSMGMHAEVLKGRTQQRFFDSEEAENFYYFGIYDVDFEFNNSEEWYESIPKDVRPRKDQPFYHLLAENNEITYEAYVSEQNLILDDSDEPIKHPLINEIFSGRRGSSYFKPSN